MQSLLPFAADPSVGGLLLGGSFIGLAALGILGIVFELHVLPGRGLSGFLGLAALLGAVALGFGGIPIVFVVVQSLAFALVVSLVLFVLASRVFPQNAVVQRLSFHDAQGRDYVASSDHRALIGQHGVASSLLRPAGVAAIEGQRVDVLTEGDFVPAGTAVVVTRVEGARIFVRAEGDR
jgi:membrane-bound serine protease (ClpP class)